MNVNGMACGIEMYLGQDVLSLKNGLSPILWKAYNEKEAKYQGEVADKGMVQEAFREKLKRNVAGDYGDLDSVVKMIFRAFQ